MRSETQRKGEVARLKVMLRAYERGNVVSVPTVDAPYDLVIDVDGLKRVQVKYADGGKAEGSAVLWLRRNSKSGKTLQYKKDELDALAVYIPAIDKVLWFEPCDFLGKSSLAIRYAPAKNKQEKGVIWADNFVW